MMVKYTPVVAELMTEGEKYVLNFLDFLPEDYEIFYLPKAESYGAANIAILRRHHGVAFITIKEYDVSLVAREAGEYEWEVFKNEKDRQSYFLEVVSSGKYDHFQLAHLRTDRGSISSYDYNYIPSPFTQLEEYMSNFCLIEINDMDRIISSSIIFTKGRPLGDAIKMIDYRSEKSNIPYFVVNGDSEHELTKESFMLNAMDTLQQDKSFSVFTDEIYEVFKAEITGINKDEF